MKDETLLPDQLREALECAGDAIEITDTNARVFFVNAAFEAQSGYRRDPRHHRTEVG